MWMEEYIFFTKNQYFPLSQEAELILSKLRQSDLEQLLEGKEGFAHLYNRATMSLGIVDMEGD